MFDFYSLIAAFLLIHLLCDFYLQPDTWIASKKAHGIRSWALYTHALLHGFGLLIPAAIIGLSWHSMVSMVVIVAVSHFLIDWWKVSVKEGEQFKYFAIDQLLHVAVLAAIAFHMTESATLENVVKHALFPDTIMVLAGYLFIFKPSSIVIGSILKKYTVVTGDAKTQSALKGLIDGGELIGYLERTLILTFVLADSYAAVGFVLAAKSIFRFGELNKDEGRSMTEYVLIGSLLSVVITTLTGALIKMGLS
ncbi:DUF3307 domain-containing protein [Alteromonas sp. AMM-1]|uniref:DUF3307 domain-containing protein n=1 Tax=Alteromonas sp. AMM-1 TaxID=3394233 RepID=UPI0039A5338A